MIVSLFSLQPRTGSHHRILAGLLLCTLLLSACDNGSDPEPEPEPLPVLGTVQFNGQEVEVNSTAYRTSPEGPQIQLELGLASSQTVFLQLQDTAAGTYTLSAQGPNFGLVGPEFVGATPADSGRVVLEPTPEGSAELRGNWELYVGSQVYTNGSFRSAPPVN